MEEKRWKEWKEISPESGENYSETSCIVGQWEGGGMFGLIRLQISMGYVISQFSVDIYLCISS